MPKLTYEQMRQLSELGAPEGRLVLKNRKGVILKSQLSKWGSPLETKSTSSAVALRPYHVHLGSHSLTFPQASSLQPRRPRAKP